MGSNEGEKEEQNLGREERRKENIRRLINWLIFSVNTGTIGTLLGLGSAMIMDAVSGVWIYGLIGFFVGFIIPIFIYFVDISPYYEWIALKDELNALNDELKGQIHKFFDHFEKRA